jgi:hypothetical protein
VPLPIILEPAELLMKALANKLAFEAELPNDKENMVQEL